MSRSLRVLHLVDASTAWDQRRALEQLLERRPDGDETLRVVSVGPATPETARLPLALHPLPHRGGPAMLTAPALAGMLEGESPDLVHAWGTTAAAISLLAVRARVPIAISIFDPGITEPLAKRLRTDEDGNVVAVLCAGEIVRRRLIERGVAPERTALVRPGVDFAVINRAKRSGLRAALGVASDQELVATIAPGSRAGGHFAAFWATAVRALLEPSLRIVVPGRTRETRRLRRLADELHMGEVLLTPGDRWRPEELLAVADVMLAPGTREGSVTGIAWAMAAGVPVVATALPATAELLAHGHNAVLVKPDPHPKCLGIYLADLLGQRSQWHAIAETARGQAFEVFSVRRYVDQTRAVYENLLAGRPPADGLRDPALVG